MLLVQATADGFSRPAASVRAARFAPRRKPAFAETRSDEQTHPSPCRPLHRHRRCRPSAVRRIGRREGANPAGARAIARRQGPRPRHLRGELVRRLPCARRRPEARKKCATDGALVQGREDRRRQLRSQPRRCRRLRQSDQEGHPCSRRPLAGERRAVRDAPRRTRRRAAHERERIYDLFSQAARVATGKR